MLWPLLLLERFALLSGWASGALNPRASATVEATFEAFKRT